MRHSFIPALLVACGGSQLASAIALPLPADALNGHPNGTVAPPAPLKAFDVPKTLLSPDEAKTIAGNNSPDPLESHAEVSVLAATTSAATTSTCTNPRIRTEWDSLDNNGRQAFVTALKCMMTKPQSGQFSQAKSRYEDFVALHQALTDNVHNNQKFLVWHRYYTWVFEEALRSECNYGGTIPWFDERNYAGKFDASSIFSSQWFGSVNKTDNGCVTDGQFANLVLNVGPIKQNYAHCLARNNDDSMTAECSKDRVDICQAATDYSAMAKCAEGSAHAYGHNGIGAVMLDTYASPSDPVFWLHHSFIDRNFRVWQNADSNRVKYIDGVDHFGTNLSLDMLVSVNGIKPDVPIRDILDTMGGTLCYKYNY